MSAKLVSLLDSWGVPESGFQDIVNRYTEATKLNVSFANQNKTRRATIDALTNTIPQHICHSMSPHTVSVDLVGIDEPVELVRFDAVNMILSLLHNQHIMQSTSLVTTYNNPFDNYQSQLDTNCHIGEPRTGGTVYQNYLHALPNNDDVFVFDLIIYIDSTPIDTNGHFTCCLLYTSDAADE